MQATVLPIHICDIEVGLHVRPQALMTREPLVNTNSFYISVFIHTDIKTSEISLDLINVVTLINPLLCWLNLQML